MRAGFLILALGAWWPGFGQAGPGAAAVTVTGFSDAAVYNGDQIARVDVSVQLDVRLAGTYRVSFDLTARNGNVVSRRLRAALEPGARTLTANFEASEIRDYLEQDGPYRIADVRVFREVAGAAAEYVTGMPLGGETQAYALSGQPREEYRFTGEISAEGIEPAADGTFGRLRVRVGVETTGGNCGASAELTDDGGEEIDVQDGRNSQLPAGKAQIEFLFDGADIRRSGTNGPLRLRGLELSCRGRGILSAEKRVVERRGYAVGRFRAADFYDPGHKLRLGSPIPEIAAGDSVSPAIVFDGTLDSLNLTMTVEADTPGLQVTNQDWRDCASAPVCRTGRLGFPNIRAAADLAPGRYPMRVHLSGDGVSESMEFDIVVSRELTEAKRRRDAALRAVEAGEPPEPRKELETRSDADLEPVGPPTFYNTGIALRKIHAVLVLDRSGSMRTGDVCRFMRAAATNFVKLFADGRDSIAVVSYSTTAKTVLPMTERFLADGPGEIAKIECESSTNTAGALAEAAALLAANDDPEAINAVILFTDGQADSIAAEWPLKAAEELKVSLRASPGSFRPGGCRQPPGSIQGVLVPLGGAGGRLPVGLRFAQMHAVDPRGNEILSAVFDRCLPPEAVAFMPEVDSYGTPLTGRRPLERFNVGPYAGKIRLDVAQNVVNAVENEVANAIQKLRSGPHAPFLYCVGFDSGPAGTPLKVALEQMFGGTDGKLPDGLGIVAQKPEEFWPAFQRIRRDLIERATVR